MGLKEREKQRKRAEGARTGDNVVKSMMTQEVLLDQKEKIVALMNAIESELSELIVMPEAEAHTKRAWIMVKHVKWAVRDGEKIDLEAIREEVNDIEDKE